MIRIKMQEAFEREINMLDNDVEKPASVDTEYWINAGILTFIKTRYTGNNYKLKGFEQDQKRTDDLRTLVKTEIIPVEDNKVELPYEYMYMLGDRVGILPIGANDNCWKKDEYGNYITRYTDTLEAKIEDIDRQLENSLSEYHLHYCQARPLKLITGNQVSFYTDNKYYISSYQLTYLRKPEEFTLDNPFSYYTELPDEVLYECIKIAAKLYIENKGLQRYNTISNEINQME